MIEEIIIAVVAGIIILIITELLFKKNKESMPVIRAGRDISTEGDLIVGDKITHKNYNFAKSKNNIETFEKYLNEKTDWKIIDGNEEWIYIKDNSFKIKCEQQLGDFAESWMKLFSFDINAKKGRKYKVCLFINGNKIYETTFILIEPNKSFVPLPKQEFNEEGKVEKYFWEKHSLEYKIYKIVKPFYDMSSLEEMAEKSDLLEMR